MQCSRVLYGSGGRGRVLYGGGRVCDGVHSTRPSGERSYRSEARGSVLSGSRGRNRVLYGSGGVCGGVHNTRPSGGRSYRGEAHGIRPWVETQVYKVTINCGYRCGRDRVSHLLKLRGRVISAIRYSVAARVYLPVIPLIMVRAPRMVAIRGPGDEWREGRIFLQERRSGGDENRRGEWREGRVLLPERRSGGDENRRGKWREGRVLLPWRRRVCILPQLRGVWLQGPKDLRGGQTSSTIEGGRGCNIFVPVFGGKGTKIAPTGNIFDQPPGQMR